MSLGLLLLCVLAAVLAGLFVGQVAAQRVKALGPAQDPLRRLATGTARRALGRFWARVRPGSTAPPDEG